MQMQMQMQMQMEVLTCAFQARSLIFLRRLLHSVLSSLSYHHHHYHEDDDAVKAREDLDFSSDQHRFCGPLTASFCSALLHNDSASCETKDKIDGQEGFPYPLYKHLATAIRHFVLRGLSLEVGLVEGFEIQLTEQQQTQFKDLGSSLLKVFSETNWPIHVQEPYFSFLREGTKNVEGRCATGSYKQIQAGDLLLVNDALLLIVQKVNQYSSFSEMLEKETLANILPNVHSIAEGINVYRKFYSEETEQKGVLAIHVCRSAASTQPYKLLVDLLHELQIEGLISLLQTRLNIDIIKDVLRSSFEAI